MAQPALPPAMEQPPAASPSAGLPSESSSSKSPLLGPTQPADGASATAPSTSKPPYPDFPFLSHEPKVGDPPSNWADLKHPKLRKYPKSISTIRIKRFIGEGVDGRVYHGFTDDGKEVAIKFFHYDKLPDPNDHKWRADQVINYWAFELECRNCATLDIISSRLRRAASSGQPVFLNPNPKTRNDALKNLRGFADDYADKYRAHAGYEPFNPPAAQIAACYGWMCVSPRTVARIYNKHETRGLYYNFYGRKDVFAIVYEFVPEGTHEDDVVLASLELFYMAGFYVEWQVGNWRGQGILVDHCDMWRPDEPSPFWPPEYYSRTIKDKGADGGWAFKRLLPPPRPPSRPPHMILVRDPSLPSIIPPPPRGARGTPAPRNAVYVMGSIENPGQPHFPLIYVRPPHRLDEASSSSSQPPSDNNELPSDRSETTSDRNESLAGPRPT